MSPKKSIEISFVTPGSRGFSVFAHSVFALISQDLQTTEYIAISMYIALFV